MLTVGEIFTESPPTYALTPRLNPVNVTRETGSFTKLSMSSRELPNLAVFSRELRNVGVFSRDLAAAPPLCANAERREEKPLALAAFSNTNTFQYRALNLIFLLRAPDRRTWTLFTFLFNRI